MLYLVLPAYNEERDIAALLTRVQEFMPELKLEYKVLVVNDGSTDNTLAVANSFAATIPLEVLDHGTNKGLGQAILTGLRRANELATDEDVIVSMDADNTHNPQLMEAMVKCLDSGKDIVIASRYEAGGKEIGLSYSRHVFSRGASLLLGFFFPIPGAKDYTCGYRAFRGEMLHRAFAAYRDRLIEERGFTCMAEILIKMGKLSARVGEVPLVLRYDLKSGKSKMKVFRTIQRYGILIARNKLRSTAIKTMA
jgi:dolichol-phosphate mannosyltransferase